MMMSSGSTALQTSDSGSGGNRRTPCSFYGCKRVYSDMTALESHIKDHDIPAQSLPGKVLLCSTVGCSGSFPNMQKLMEHMRHHHKPNIFFLCESCRTKLRSYRGLLTHLHTCSKVPRGKTKTPPLPASTHPNASFADADQKPPLLDQKPPLLDSMSSPQQLTYHTPNSEDSFPAADEKPDPAAHLLLSPPFLSNLETSPPPQLTEADLQPEIKVEATDVPILPGPAAAPDSPDAQSQYLTQTRSLEPVHPGPESAPRSPPGATIVWKKGQGQVYSRRILWEHTRGRYTCVQCGHAVTNRKEMSQHISTKHSGNKPAEDTGSSAYNT